MQKNWQEFQNCRRKYRSLVKLFYLDLLLVILTIITLAVDFRNFSVCSFFLTIIVILFILYTLIYLLKNQNIMNQIETLFLKNQNGAISHKLGCFQRLVEYNLFQYHFQPIIDARTGDIFAYEILMRTDKDTIDLAPVEILNLATKEGCLYHVERYTYYNALRIMKENKELFQNKKLFINSINGHQLTVNDFEELYHNYGPLFQNVVIEIAETSLISDEGLQLLLTRRNKTGCQLAMDDYGIAHPNESNIFTSNPDYIKIDGSILRHINVDEAKQHIVTNLIRFAQQNKIKIIAEGIETAEEFEYIISLGVDYVQGYYTARPNPDLLPKVGQDIIDKLQEINSRRQVEGIAKKLYETQGDKIIYPVALVLEMYSEVLIREPEITIRGSHEMIANASIIIPDHYTCQITLDHVRLRGSEKPAIILGKNCCVTLILVGDNDILFNGIRVPETSELKIIGEGNLSIQAEDASCVGIGGTPLQAYGNLLLATTGCIRVTSSGNVSVAVGGGQNPYQSLIHIISGLIYIETSGYKAVGIGNISGNAWIKIEGKVKLTTEGSKAVGIGSLFGNVDIASAGSLILKCCGRNAVAIGSLEDSCGSISISGGITSIRLNANCGTGIGAIDGGVGIDIHQGDISIYGEGVDIIGIGGHSGFGVVHIKDGIISVQLYAPNAITIGNARRNIVIDGGNIQCDFTNDIIPVNSYKIPLEASVILATDEFRHKIDSVNYSYEYHASHCERYPYIKVYLPEGTTL